MNKCAIDRTHHAPATAALPSLILVISPRSFCSCSSGRIDFGGGLYQCKQTLTRSAPAGFFRNDYRKLIVSPGLGTR